MLRTVDAHILQHTKSLSEAFARRLASYAPKKHVDHSFLPAQLLLPIPEPLTPQLIEIGVDIVSANRISSIFTNAASLLKKSCETGFERRRQSLQSQAHYFQDPKDAARIPLAYSSLYNKSLRDWTSHLLTNILPRILQAQRFRSCSPSRRPFNQSAVPILEQFFSVNAFPTRLEKYDLALRCDMDYKQIHIWFQNRRSRSRKEGQPLKRVSEGSILRQLEDTAIQTLLPPGPEDDNDVGFADVVNRASGENKSATKVEAVFYLESPPHAFPSPYPPLCSYDPFPVAQQKRVFLTSWMRRPAPATRVPAGDVDLEDLVTAFGRLHLGDSSTSAQSGEPRQLSYATDRPSCIGFVTRCARAPLPALIRQTGRLSRASGWLRLSSSPGCHRIPLQPGHDEKLRKQSHTFSDSSASRLSPPSTRRPKRTLPRRTPKHLPALVRIDTPRSFIPRSTSAASFSSESSTSDCAIITPSSTPPLRPIISSPDSSFLPLLTLDVELTSNISSKVVEGELDQLLDPLAFIYG